MILGQFTCTTREPGPIANAALRPMREYVVQVEVDPESLARMLGPRAVRNRRGISSEAGGRVRVRLIGAAK